MLGDERAVRAPKGRTERYPLDVGLLISASSVVAAEALVNPFYLRRSRRPSWSLVFALGLALVLGGCGASGSAAPSVAGSDAPSGTQADATVPPPSSGSTDCVGSGAVFCGHISVTGGITRELDFVSSPFVDSCAVWVKGDRNDLTTLVLPVILEGDLNVDFHIYQNYHGPASYEGGDLAGGFGPLMIAVGHDTFELSGKATATATVAGDGSGSVVATALQPTGDSNVVQVPVDVNMTWTCYTK